MNRLPASRPDGEVMLRQLALEAARKAARLHGQAHAFVRHRRYSRRHLDLLRQTAEELDGLLMDLLLPRCRVCGCTEYTACADPRTGEPCRWVAADLCSACEKGADHAR
jgi:hypothetical protein